MNPTVSTLSVRMRRCFKLFLVVSLLSLGLHAAGCGTRGWMVWNGIFTANGPVSGVKISVGLWDLKFCDGARVQTCETISHSELSTRSSGIWSMQMLEFQVEVCLALALLTIYTVTLLACFCCDYKPRILKWVMYCMIFVTTASGTLALIASGKFGDDHRKLHEQLQYLSPFLFPYSLILTGVGGILACLQALVMFPALKPWQPDPETRASAYTMDRSLALDGKPASHQGHCQIPAIMR